MLTQLCQRLVLVTVSIFLLDLTATEARGEGSISFAGTQIVPLTMSAPVPKDFRIETKLQEWKCKMTCMGGEEFSYSLNVNVPVRQVYEKLGDEMVPKYCFLPSRETLDAANKAYCGSEENVKEYDCTAPGANGNKIECGLHYF